MCSISGFSFTPCSRFNARKVSSALLVAGRSRGTDASGYGYLDPHDSIHVATAAGDPQRFVNSRRFALPREARTAILHTRLATQGLPSNERNNHPVYRFDKDGKAVALVHNGCITNDYRLFREHQVAPVAQVDSEILPALIAKSDVPETAYRQVLGEVSGSCATGWLDERTPGTLHLARAHSSPLHVAHVLTGSATGVMFASTERMLREGLRAMGLHLSSPGVTHYVIAEGQYLTVTQGEWDVLAYPFPFPKPAYVPNWRAGGATGRKGSNKGSGTGTGYAGRHRRSQAQQPMGEWGWWNDTETWDTQAWGSYFVEGVENPDSPVIEGEVIEDVDAAREEGLGDRELHRLYCEAFYCALDDESHCPEYWSDLDQSSHFAAHDESDRTNAGANPGPIAHYSDEEINHIAARMFIESGLG